MKNKKLLFIILISIILVIGCIILIKNINKSYRAVLGNNDKKIIAEKAYMNFAWGFQYNGMAIFNDGTIYKWNFEGRNTDYKVTTFEEHTKWILENGTLINKKVTEEDLKEIEQNIHNLEDNITRTSTAYDAGSNYISVWDINNKEITLKESGDYTGENETNSSKNIINIVNKYLK